MSERLQHISVFQATPTSPYAVTIQFTGGGASVTIAPDATAAEVLTQWAILGSTLYAGLKERAMSPSSKNLGG